MRFIGKHEIKIPGIGGILHANDLQKLVSAVGLQSEELSFADVNDFSMLVRKSVDTDVPLLLPVDRNAKNGANAHFAVIVGYEEKPDKSISIIMSHDGDYAQLDATELYHLNHNLVSYPVSNYVKPKKHTEYELSENATSTYFYKKYTYPETDLTKQYQNKVFAVTSKQLSWNTRPCI